MALIQKTLSVSMNDGFQANRSPLSNKMLMTLLQFAYRQNRFTKAALVQTDSFSDVIRVRLQTQRA